MDWFLYDISLRHERFKQKMSYTIIRRGLKFFLVRSFDNFYNLTVKVCHQVFKDYNFQWRKFERLSIKPLSFS